MHRMLVILGAGYLARFIRLIHPDRYSDVRFTSRSPAINLSDVSTDRRILFDLAQPETWSSIPRDADLLWSFPAAPLEAVQRFAARINGSCRRVVVLGSTSAYDVAASSDTYPPPWIDETASVDLSIPRVQGEEFLRTNYAAVVLRVAGIYGPGRHPFDWIRHGRVQPSRKYVNLIHVEDLAAICQHVTGDDNHATGKRISNAKLLAMLHTAGASIHRDDLYASLSCTEHKRSAE
jgi:hypothetical protein